MRVTFIGIAAVLLSSWSLPVCARTQATDQETAVLMRRYETVFYASGDAVSDLYRSKGEGDRARLRLRIPFMRLFGAFAALRPGAAQSIFQGAKAVLMGAKDFRPPRSDTGLGFVQSTFCYVVLSQGANIELGTMGAKPVGEVPGRPAWTWPVPREEGQAPMTLHASRLDHGRLLVCNDLTELQSVASALVSDQQPPLDENIARTMAALRPNRIWGVRLLRGPSWESRLLERSERLAFRADTATGEWSLWVIGRSTLESDDLNSVVSDTHMQWRSIGVKQWELNGRADDSSGQFEALYAAMSLMGFGAYL